MAETLGEKVKAARLRAGLTQLELSAKLGVTPTTISKWERGVSVPLPRYLRKLAQRFGLQPAEAA